MEGQERGYYIFYLFVNCTLWSVKGRQGISEYYINLSQYSLEEKRGGNIFYLPVPYLFDNKLGVFSFQINPKYLDLSYKTDLDLWDCLERVKLVL